MRRLSVLIAGSILASCTTAPPEPAAPRSPKSDQQLQQLLAGKVAKPSISCLPSYNQTDMRIIDGRTIAFRNGPGGTVYMVTLSSGCELLKDGPYALVSRSPGGMGLCQGDIQTLMDTMSHMNAGSCTVQSIVPYARP